MHPEYHEQMRELLDTYETIGQFRPDMDFGLDVAPLFIGFFGYRRVDKTNRFGHSSHIYLRKKL